MLFMLSLRLHQKNMSGLNSWPWNLLRKINLQFSFVLIGSQYTLVSRQIKSTNKNQ